MLLKKIDMISPPITLYYKGEPSHSSVYAGLLTIIVYGISIAICFSYAIDFFLHKNPSVCYYNRYAEDAGEFPINSSSMFSFIQILDTASNVPENIDFDSIRIIGIEQTIDLYEQNNDLSLYNHWIYGPCDNNSDTKGISHLINFKHFDESACIKKYYKKNNNQYYDKNDKEFIFPNILHGCSHPDRTFYGIIVEKCRNDSLRIKSNEKFCKSNEQIKKYIQTRSMALQIIDQFADVLNYNEPYSKYFYSITSGLFEGSYTTNHLNFNPSTLITHNGILFDNTIETKSYFFEQNEKITTNMEIDKGIYVAFYYWMQNRMQYYERTYQRIQDTLSDIGGMCSILLTVAYILNFIFSEYFVLKDSEEVLTHLEKLNLYDKEILQKNLRDFFNTKDFDVKASPVKKQKISRSKTFYPSQNLINDQINFQQENISNQQNINQEINNEQKNNKNKNKRKQINSIVLNNLNVQKNSSEQKDSFNIMRKNSRKKSKKSSKISRINIPDLKESSFGTIIFKDKNTAQRSFVKKSEKKEKDENSNNIVIGKMKEKKIEKEKKVGFCEFISFFMCCNNNTKANYFEEFRRNILSEENIILSYFNIAKLLKTQELKTEVQDQTKIDSLLLSNNQ